MSELPKVRVLNFYTRYMPDRKTGNRTRAVDYVEFAPAQAMNAHSTTERVEFLRPNFPADDDDESPSKASKKAYMEALWSVIGPAYDAWKKGFAIPEQGTPLAAWAGVTADLANALRKIGILTVEDLASLADDKFTRVPIPNVREVRDLARKYLSSDGDTKTAERLTALEDQNKALQDQLEAAMELLKEADEERARKPRKVAEAA